MSEKILTAEEMQRRVSTILGSAYVTVESWNMACRRVTEELTAWQQQIERRQGERCRDVYTAFYRDHRLCYHLACADKIEHAGEED